MKNNNKIFATISVCILAAVLIVLSIIFIPQVVNKNLKEKYEPTVFAENGAYTWWTNSLALRYVGEKDITYISYVSEKGEMSVKSLDHDTGEYKSFILAEYEKDDHNSAALGVLPDGRILAVYARHGIDRHIRWRISNVEDISHFGEEKAIASAKGVTYIQLHRIGESFKYRIFYRYSSNSWATMVYDYEDDTWTDEVVWLTEPNGGQYYLWIQEDKVEGKLNVFMTCHPTNGKDQAIRYGYFDKEDNICTIGGLVLGNLNIKVAKKLSPRDFDVAFEPQDEMSTRLFDVSYMGDKVACLFGVFPVSAESCDYKYCYYDEDKGAWTVNTITQSGKAAVQANHYYGGVTFDKKDMQTVYVSKELEGVWYIERWVTEDFGETWRYIKVDESKEDVLIRPIVPYNANDDVCVLYMKGKYPSYVKYDTDIVSLKFKN